jgi:tetratricopeptide (TPR) repeat protein
MSSGRHTDTSDWISPGTVLAARYRIVARLGRGGMGEVWRADDLVLGTPVALKFLTKTGSDARLRILNEVRLARQVTHPVICRVFDVGEADGIVFFSMELVEGEDLAALLSRAGRLPAGRVVEIGRELCAGLQAAHRAGVLHRDLKPANVLIDGAGRIRITDFGIAVTATETRGHTLIGTPEYMAPEQFVGGVPLSARTDIYALGLLLFELLTGEHALADGGSIEAPRRPSRIVAGVDPRLERAIMKAIAASPRDRFASAEELSEALSASTSAQAVRPIKRRAPWVAAGAVAAAMVAALLAYAFITPERAPILTEQDVIVLADFQNTTGEPVFDGTLKVALSVALEQSPFLKMFPDDRVLETLRLMGRAPDERVTRAVAREIAQREHLKALVAGTISRLGTHYVIAVEAINAETGDIVAREQVEATSQENVLTAVGRATSRLRERLGESLASIQKFDVPLPRATTSSLEALHAYARARDEGRMNLRLEAIPHLKRALELDPDFALAQAELSGVYTNTNQTSLAPVHSRRAFELRDRVSERERFFIGFRYYRDATQEWDKALELAQQWSATYPRESLAFNALGIARLRFGEYEGAIPPIREAIRLDPKFMPLYANLAGVLMALDRFEEAKQVLRDGEAQQIDYFNAHRIAYLIAFIEGDQTALERHIGAGLRLDQNSGAYGWRAHGLMFNGRFEDARDQFRVGTQVALQSGFREVAARLAIENMEGRALVGLCDRSVEDLTAALGWSRDNFALERSARALILCGHESEGERLANELITRYPAATLVQRISRPLLHALLALQRQQPARAIALLEPVRPLDHAPWAGYWPAYVRGRAHLVLREGRLAAAAFKTILDHRGEDPDAVLYPLAQLGFAQAVAIDDEGRGRSEYDRFFAMWKDADLHLPLIDACRCRPSTRPSQTNDN